MSLPTGHAYYRRTNSHRDVNRGTVYSPVPDPPPVVPEVGYTLTFEDQFATLDAGRWLAYDNSTFGAEPTNMRVQRYMAANNVTGAASAGATGGTSLKQLTKREAVGGNEFTAGMIDSKGRGRYYPCYGRYTARMKMPHGHGLWPAFWLTARQGGASMCEVDIMEYFHAQIPGRTVWTLHRTDAAGVPRYNVAKNRDPVTGSTGTFFENPTYTPGWHVIDVSILPWTATTVAAGQAGDPNSPSANVRFVGRLNGAVVWDYVDTQAIYWTSNGGPLDQFFNVYFQGCQVGGAFVGHPDDPLGYSRYKNTSQGGCTVSGTPPNACTTVFLGRTVQRAGAPGPTATFLNTASDAATTFEIDYVRVERYTG